MEDHIECDCVNTMVPENKTECLPNLQDENLSKKGDLHFP